MGDPFHDKESEQFVARYIERAPLSLEKLSIPDFAEATSGHFRRRERIGKSIKFPIISSLYAVIGRVDRRAA